MVKTEWEWWVCRRGHRVKARKGVKEVWCGVCANTAGLRGSNEMKPERMFPSWATNSGER